MNQSAVVNRSPIAGVSPRLCNSVEGVEFWIESPKGQRLRCVITEAALQGHFGAHAFADSWLFAFEQHRTEIERRAFEATGRREDVHIVMVNDSEGRLKASAGRCRA